MKHCQDCGQDLPPNSGRSRRFCDECIRKHKQDYQRMCAEVYKLKREAKKKEPVKTLAEIQREATECGMSYGQYVANIKK